MAKGHVPVIVVADDEADCRQLITTLLGFRHYRVLEASDGVEALALVEHEHPDVLITDLLMPHMDGFELARRIHADARLRATRVIFYTASYHSRRAERLAIECGAHAILYKPAEPEAVLAAVDAALDLASPASIAPLSEAELRRLHSDVVREKAEVYRFRLRAARQRLIDLAALGQTLAAEQAPVQLIKTFCARARDILLSREAGVALTNGDGDAIELAVRCGADGVARILAGRQPVDLALRNATLTEGGLFEAAAAAAAAAALRIGHTGPGTVFAAPIATASVQYGWLCVSSPMGNSDDDAFDEASVATMAAQLAVSFEKTRQGAELREAKAMRAAEVSARARTEAALRIADADFRYLFDNVMDGMIEWTCDGQLRLVNSALVDLLEYESVTDVLRLTVGDLLRDPSQCGALQAELESNESVRNFRLQLKQKDGGTVHTLVNARVVRPVRVRNPATRPSSGTSPCCGDPKSGSSLLCEPHEPACGSGSSRPDG